MSRISRPFSPAVDIFVNLRLNGIEKNLRLERAGRAGPWAMRTAPWGRRNRLIIMLQGHFRDWENFLIKLMQYLTF